MKAKIAPPDHIVSILEAGIQAPSGDNCQPWAFKVDGNYIDFYLRSEVDRSFFNFKQLASIISCGAVLENMRCEAARLGYMVEFEIDGEGDFSKPILKIHVDKSMARQSDFISLSKVIYKRCTNRKMYNRRPIPADHLKHLKREAENHPGCELHLFTDRKDIFRLARLVYMADRLRTERRDLHEHLMNMIRWTDEEVLEKKDGLPLKNLEAGFAGELFLKATRPWRVMNILNKVGISRFVALHSFRQLLNSAAVALITVPSTEIEDFLKGGIMVEQFWLAATSMGLAVQPVAALALFVLRMRAEGMGAFSRAHWGLLRKASSGFDALKKVDSSWPCLLFRLGFADQPKSRTIRHSLEEFLCES